MTFRDWLLHRPVAFAFFNFLINVNGRSDEIINDYIRPLPNNLVVDVACGNGEYSTKFKAAKYIGVDLNPAYIEYAQKHYSEYGKFVCADVSDLSSVLSGNKIDIVLLIGVLHHLTDDQAKSMLHDVSKHLAPTGRVISVDPVFTPDPGLTARLLAAADRGKYVRLINDHRRILEESLVVTQSEIREDWLRIPYTHYVCVSQLVN